MSIITASMHFVHCYIEMLFSIICVCVYCTGDVDGTLEAILDILETYDSPHCQLHVLSYSVGNVTETDIDMAATFDGNILMSVTGMNM